MKTKELDILKNDWATNPRWKGIIRPYKPEDVLKLSGTIRIDHSLARLGAKKLWDYFTHEPSLRALGAMTGTQAVQQIQAGLKVIYVSGWQVAGDANDALETYPDQSLYPCLSVPHLIRRINNALIRADQIQHLHQNGNVDWQAPMIVDAEAGFGGPLNAFELVKAMIKEGASGIHLEDQLSSLKKCGHMGGKVLVPTSDFIEKLITARLAADVMGVPTILIGRTDAEAAGFIRSDSDPVDQPFIENERSFEGFYKLKPGIELAIARANAFAPYCDLVWCETSKPDLGQAREFAQGIHEKHPGKWLAFNCSPSFNWKKFHNEKTLREFHEKLAELGYKFQFITLAGFHTLNASMFDLAQAYNKDGMMAYSKVQEEEFELEKKHGYKAIKHQQFVGAGYFDEVLMTLTAGQASTSALKSSTEEAQFHH